VSLLRVNIPNTVYNVNSSNNTLVFNRSSTDYTVTLTPSIYNLSTLCSALQTAMNTLDSNTYTVTASDSTLKVTIAGSGVFNIKWASSTMNILLGFGTTNSSNATSHVASSVYNVKRDNFLYLNIDQLYSGMVMTSTSSTAYLFYVPFDENSGQYCISYESGTFDQHVALTTEKQLLTFTVSLYDSTGALVDLNGAHWDMLLSFE
jgi:hypothetical protein